MKLTWYGHACFLLETAEGSVVFDPYEPGSVPGLKLPALTADLVLCSHGHHDHAWREGVRLSGRTPELRVETLDTWHDKVGGALRGPNTVHVVEAEGLRLAHLGDLGHPLTPEQVAALGRVDILLVPVGGHYTIGPESAWAQVEALGPALTVPMHYRGKGFGYAVIGTVEPFLKLAGPVVRLDSNSFDPAAVGKPATVVPRCPLG